ncbi:MAG: GTP 3',8-cyclase MoaA [Candidatus Caldatribacteriota bacterium]
MKKGLIDTWGRKITYLRVSVTDRCNYRCIYCLPEKEFQFIPHQEILRYEEILTIIQEATQLGLTRIRITGGEPLVRKGLDSFIYKLREIKELEDLSMTTNGFFLAEYAQTLKKAGLKRVNLSLDSLKPERYKMITRGGNLNQVLKGLEVALKVGLSPLKINMVLMKGVNDDEIDDFIKFALSESLILRFIELMPSNEGISGEVNGKFFPLQEVKEDIIKKYSLKLVESFYGNGPADYYQSPGEKSTIGFITALSQHFCKSCNRIRLTSEGKIRPCLFSNQEVDLKKIIRELSPIEDKENLRKIIRNQLIKAVKIKPEGHKIKEKFSEQQDFIMSRVGG